MANASTAIYDFSNILCDNRSSSADTEAETDHLALLSVKKHITSDPYQIMPLWNDSIHFCNWTCIVCGLRHQRVVSLDLASRGFSGSISPAVGNLTFLRDLILRNNSFTGNVPQEVGRLSRLRRLRLSNNSLSGEIPSNISRCPDLVELDLSRNNFIGVIPNEFESLTKLMYIDLGYNELTGEIPKYIGNFTSLTVISGSRNNFQGNIPDTLGQLSNLWYFGFPENNLSGILPLSFFNISSLKTIDLPDNQIGGNLPSDIAQRFLGLTVLNLPVNKISGPIPPSLSNATNLEHLALDENAFTGSVPNFSRLQRLRWFRVNINQLGNGKSDNLDFVSSLANCTNLTRLGFSSNNLGGVLPRSVFNFTLLTSFTVGRNFISGNIPYEIGQLVNVRRVLLSYNQFTGRIPDSIGNLRNIGELSLGDNLLSGSIPSSLGNLTLLSSLSLDGNKLEGNIPSGLSNCRGLQLLDLSRNNLSGHIPKEIFGLSSLTVGLDLSDNRFVGSLPIEVGALQNLVFFDVSNNMISGVIPVSLGACTSLVVLAMAGNTIEGEIPTSFRSLRGLEALDLSTNNLTGRIPEYLGDFVFLEILNLSLNGFDGKLPELGAFRNVSIVSIYGNTKLCGGLPEFQLPKCPIEESSKKNHVHLSLLLLIPIVIMLFVLILVVMFCLVCKQRYSKKASTEISSEDENFPRVSYQSLHEATDGFSSANLIGSGKFSAVCKAILHMENEPQVVAVKVLKLAVQGADRSFIAECEALRSIRHRNLVKVLTCCSSLDFQGYNFKALVYSYMANGSLEDWLHQNPVIGLNFLQRLNIVIDLAGALDYIHRQCGSLMIHCDIKPSNVLLDTDLVSHLSDFGLARFLHHDSSTSHTSSLGIKGTIGYAAPEYGLGSKVSTYGDIYSLGILILELFTGNRPTDEMFSNGLSLHSFVRMAIPDQVTEITDPVLFRTTQEKNKSKDAHDCEMYCGIKDCLCSVYRIGIACSMEIPGDRIEMSNVLDKLVFVKKTFLQGFVSYGAETDHLALLSVKKHITSDPYQIMPLWNDSIHFCNWTAVNNFQGHIPDTLGQLSSLFFFGLTMNNLSGIFPTSFFNISSMTTIDLPYNQIGGSLPSGINLISGNIPSENGQLVNIERLFLNSNRFTGRIPDSIGNLRNVGVLYLSGNLLSGSIPLSLGNLTLLNTLSLGSNKLEGALPSDLSNCRGLQLLDLSRNNLSGYIPNGIFGLSSLTISLDLSNNHFVGSLPTEVGVLQNLVSLDVSNNMISGVIPETPFFDGKLPELGAFKNESTVFIYGNAKLCGGLPEFQLPKCSSEESSKKNQIPLALLITIPIISVIFVLILVVILCFVCKRKKASTENGSEDENFPRVSYQSLHEATDGFSSANLIGSGKFSTVYKAILHKKNEPQVVAVKLLKLAVHGAERSFIAECEALRSIRCWKFWIHGGGLEWKSQ
ncbi:probable LRR receptor-like serine/threonine-protein kinase At3g47570 [Cynara cardunculus var. scolymus]|uniref:probable LRR receptor-like serine/threonine-protein kinase At3g47570 n=1 Tax=Cynara cardunculus var. scolymus TaxID=59895 RepID=UPI000D62653E|nr:probable LRR receptor-like serine/threonine-protein kinase At3g47570 [Cynara cardunculus var. scolymus]